MRDGISGRRYILYRTFTHTVIGSNAEVILPGQRWVILPKSYGPVHPGSAATVQTVPETSVPNVFLQAPCKQL